MRWNHHAEPSIRQAIPARPVAHRVFRDTDSDSDADGNDAGPSGFHYLTAVMFSVRAITDSSGLLHTRLDYTPYGVAMHSHQRLDPGNVGGVRFQGYLATGVNRILNKKRPDASEYLPEHEVRRFAAHGDIAGSPTIHTDAYQRILATPSNSGDCGD